MSGGVDSSVAAFLLKEQGYEVVGLFMKLWHNPKCSTSMENSCCDETAFLEARKTAEKIGIPLYAVDAREKFKNSVVDYFINEYKKLQTPNPCVVCNKMIKFGWMLDYAKKLGCDYLATGHYARIKKEGNIYNLYKGEDLTRDQSYFLYQLDQNQLAKIVFPLGGLKKKEVIIIAKEKGIFNVSKKESREICFTANYREFLQDYLDKSYFLPGEIVDKEGKVVGSHMGLVNYTIGQRKGVTQSGIKRESGTVPLYVIGFNKEKNQLVVGEKEDLLRKSFEMEEVNFIDPKDEEAAMGKGLTDVSVRIRYGVLEVPSIVKQSEEKTRFRVDTMQPLLSVTLGQSAVLYRNDRVIGGGIIV